MNGVCFTQGVGETSRDLIVVGASAGGVEALMELCAGLPEGLPAVVLVCLHVSNQKSQLPRILARAGPLPAIHAVDGDPLRSGQLFVAPPGLHMAVEKGRVRLAFGAPENGHRPSIDVLFRTAAWAYGSRVIGVVLTGRLDDGAAGLATVKEQGGIAIVQDPATAAYADMPNAAIQATGVDYTVPLSGVAPLLARLAGEPHASRPLEPDPGDALPAVVLGPRGELNPAQTAPVGSNHEGEAALLSCPTCQGTLWRSEAGGALQFRCRVGHAFTEGSMVVGQDAAVDAALWTALRALQDQHELLSRLSSRARARGAEYTARRFAERAHIAGESARRLRDMLKVRTESDPGE